jgi:plasmid stability protein
MRRQINIPAETHYALGVAASAHGLHMQDLADEILSEYLARPEIAPVVAAARAARRQQGGE